MSFWEHMCVCVHWNMCVWVHWNMQSFNNLVSALSINLRWKTQKVILLVVEVGNSGFEVIREQDRLICTTGVF